MNQTLKLLLATAIAALAMSSCGPKPPPGQTDRDHAEDALGQMK